MRFVALHVMFNMLQTGLSSGSKVMVLGKKYDPTQEQAYKDITNLGRGGVVQHCGSCSYSHNGTY